MAIMRVSSFWRHVSVRGAIADFRVVFEQAGENRWRIAALAAAATCVTFWMIAREEVRGRPQPPKIDYITSFRPGRTEQEIIESNIENTRIQDRLAAEQAKRDEEVREIYRKLGRATGIDVDAMEAQIKKERQAEEAAKRARDAQASQAATPATGGGAKR